MHRRFRRVPFAAEVTLTIGRQSWTGELIDLAMRGALMGTEAPLPIEKGALGDLRIALSGSPIELLFQAELVHCEDNHYGFRFLSEDLATLTHLRKLIELNTGDAEATRNELSAWLHD